LADELGRWLTDGGAVLAVPSPSRRQAGAAVKEPGSRKAVLIGAGAVALILTIAIWIFRETSPARSNPEVRFVPVHAPADPKEPRLDGAQLNPKPPANRLRFVSGGFEKPALGPGAGTPSGVAPDVIAIQRGSTYRVPLAFDRAGFAGWITLRAEGLPHFVVAKEKEVLIPPERSDGIIELVVAADAPLTDPKDWGPAFPGPASSGPAGSAKAAPVPQPIPIRVVAKAGDQEAKTTLRITIQRGAREKQPTLSILPLNERNANGAPAIQIDYLRARALKYQFDTNAQTYSALVPSPSSAPARFLDPQRLVVVTATFPYQRQLEHYRQVLRCPTVEELFQRGDAPRFLGLHVQRSELSADGKEISKFQLYGNDYADGRKARLAESLQSFFRSMVIDSKNAAEWGEILGPNLATPVPWLATGSPGEYPRLTITGFIPDKTISEPPATGQIQAAPFAKLPAELRERFKGNFNAFDPWARLPADWDDAPPGNVKPPQVKPAAVPVRNKHEDLLARFIDVDVQPGKTYRYYIQVRAEIPRSLRRFDGQTSLLSPAVVVEKTIPAEHFFYVVDMPWAQMVSKEKGANDRSLANAETAAVQIHQWAHSLPRIGAVGTWVIAERLLVRRGDAIARSGVRVQAPHWEPEQGRLVLFFKGGGSADFWTEQGPFFRPPGFGPGPPLVVDSEPPFVVDFVGGKHSGYKVGNKTVYDEAAVEMLILTPDNKLVLRNSLEDTADQDRLERYQRWREELRGKDRFDLGPFRR